MNKNYKIVLLTSCLLLSISLQAMNKKSGGLSLSTNASAISDGIGNMLSDPSTLTSSLCTIAWHSINNNARSGFFDSNTLKDPHVMYSIAGGIIGKTIKSTITHESFKKLPSPIQVVIANPFLSTYVGLHCYFKYNEIKNNPLPYLGEIGLLGVHFLSKQWGY